MACLLIYPEKKWVRVMWEVVLEASGKFERVHGHDTVIIWQWLRVCQHMCYGIHPNGQNRNAYCHGGITQLIPPF